MGCGYDALLKRVYFTLDGSVVHKLDLDASKMHLAVAANHEWKVEFSTPVMTELFEE